jgi:hypothetical protein
MANDINGTETSAIEGDFFPPTRPRRPRHRVGQRNVAKPGYRSEPRDLKSFLFKPAQRSKLRKVLGECQGGRKELETELRCIATQHRHFRGQPQPSREEAAYQLKLLGYLAGKISRGGCKSASALTEFGEVLDDLNDIARLGLWRALGSHPAWPKLAASSGRESTMTPFKYLARRPIDRIVVAEAAIEASRQLKTKGDYSDLDLAISVAACASLFERWTGRQATYSTIGARRHGEDLDGNEPSSACARFVTEFFEIVDPDLGMAKAHNALRSWLASRSTA